MKKELWITNVTKRNIPIPDLNIYIPKMSSINLFNGKYICTEEEINQSIESGSIKKRSGEIFVRKVAPAIEPNYQIKMSNNFLKKQAHSVFKPIQEQYDELDITDEKFAEDNIEQGLIDKRDMA